MNENHILTAFSEPITDLADQPSLPPDEMKRRLQAPAEELRQAHNALAKSHAALDEKVEGIVTETYGGTIHESMLDVPLAEKLNGKAEQADLNAAQSDITSIQTQLAVKCEAVVGSYTGNGEESQQIVLGFKPYAVLVVTAGGFLDNDSTHYGGLALRDSPADGNINDLVTISDTGFTVYYAISTRTDVFSNKNGVKFHYIAFRAV